MLTASLPRTTTTERVISADCPKIPDATGHTNARLSRPSSYPERTFVPEALVSWESVLPGYSPLTFTRARSGVDCVPSPEELRRSFESFEGPVSRDPGNRYPLNIRGRTGLAGRGTLYFWGRNTAADAIVIRHNPELNDHEVLLIQRKDGQWALPGGFYSTSTEDSLTAALRELQEETTVTLSQIKDSIIGKPVLVYQGYADDERNTDNAWIETSAYLQVVDFHKSTQWTPTGDDDAMNAEWVPLTDSRTTKLYAGHSGYLSQAIALLNSSSRDQQSNNAQETERGFLAMAHSPDSPLISRLTDLTDRGINKLALFGGSFDPVHHGHLQVAENVLRELQVDAVLFMPAKQNPLKKNPPKASDTLRLELLVSALKRRAGLLVSDHELSRRGDAPSFTIDTVRDLKQVLPPRAKVFLVVGADTIKDLARWKDIEAISALVTFVFQPRGQLSANAWAETQAQVRAAGLPSDTIVLTSSTGEISSTAVRQSITKGDSPVALVPHSVLHILQSGNHYR